jgi:uncharacterized protein (TIGR02217 family)
VGFHEDRFPDDISYGTRFGPGFSTSVVRVASGAEERVSRWAAPLYRGNAAYGVKTWDQLDQVVNHYLARRGPANAFRWKDFRDYASTSTGRTPDTDPDAGAITDTDQTIGTGDDDTTQFQLKKTYSSGSESLERVIEKPVAGTVVVAVNGVSQSEGSDFTVNATTGVVTFAVAPTAGHAVTAGFEFDVPVRYGEEVDEDALQVSIDSFDSGSIPDIPVVEVRGEKPIVEAYPYGGSKAVQLSGADYALSSIEARVIRVTDADGTSALRLPDPAGSVILPDGDRYWIIVNESGADVPIKDQDLNLVDTCPTGEAREVLLSADISELADQTLILKDTASDLGSSDMGDAFDEHVVASQGTTTAGSISVSMGAFQTEHVYAISPAGVPNVAQWATGAWSFEFAFSSISGSAFEATVNVRRWNGSSFAESSAATTEQDIAAGGDGLYTFNLAGVSWSAGSKDDRIVVDLTLSNVAGGGAGCTIETGTTDAEFVTPVVDQSILQRWIVVAL